MNEIYWITRLDCLVNLLTGVIVASCVVLMLFMVLVSVDKDGDIMSVSKRRKYITIRSIVLAISSVTAVFVPSEKEMMLIYGLGQTVDYIQDNEAVKELPDKCVEALDLWLESLTEEE